MIQKCKCGNDNFKIDVTGEREKFICSVCVLEYFFDIGYDGEILGFYRDR